ncbi:uncharacterized protein LOC141640275 [Silene latifolia]|uniref:uncharacterized protein LOC141640275 n=1 Tax=Silene latifolia TaxID=37657 RepID=UPI003D78202B
MWSQVPDFLVCVQSYWNTYWSSTKMFRVVRKLKSLKRPLKALNQKLFADIDNSAAHAWKTLDAIQDRLKRDPTDGSLINMEKEAAALYKDLQSACHSFYIQKTKATWVNQDSAQTQNAFLSYYKELLGTAAATTLVNHYVVQLGPVCTPDHCETLLAHVTKTEIKNVIFSIPDHKAPGPNGFSSAFFKDSWNIVGEDVCQAILDFFHTGKMLQQINHTFISLIPKMKLTHLMFADDLLFFSKGDTTSIIILLRSFATFSAATGLRMNNLKSNIYFNGVHSSTKSDILQVSSFSEGIFPFKYLGVPISAGKLSIKHCYGLIEKVTERIRGFCCKEAFLFWNYLWDRSTEYLRSPLVSWTKVCVPKKEGGLGIRDSYAWNLAAICKLSNWVYNHPDSLWVKWVHHVYMKGVPWSSYIPKTDVSWSWKVVCRLRDKFAGAFSSTGQWLHNPAGYTTTSGYCWIRQPQPVVLWDKTVWNSWCIPKHSFINWLIAREALLLKDKLLQIGDASDSD